MRVSIKLLVTGQGYDSRVTVFGVMDLVFCATCAAAPAASCDAPAALHFATGSSSGEVSGGVAQGELACWTVSAKSGQVMTATIGSTGQNAVMQVYQPGWKVAKADGDYRFTGKTLKGAAEGDDAMKWSGALPKTGSFLFVVGASRGASDYKLDVKIANAR